MGVEELRICLNRLLSQNSTIVLKAAIETLLKIHRNIKFNENDPKYRKLNVQNAAFKNKVWNLYPAQDFMLMSGWVEVGGELHFHKDENLWYIIDVLIEYRNVTPCSSEWQKHTKIENLYVSEQKEKYLRAKAALERQKELDEYKKEKLYREQINENMTRKSIRRIFLDNEKCMDARMRNALEILKWDIQHHFYKYYETHIIFTNNVKKQIADDRKNRTQYRTRYVNSAYPRNRQQARFQVVRRLGS